MKYKCLIFDHDDTVVNSTATIHQPCFQQFLDEFYPGKQCPLDEYFEKNFDPGFLAMCRGEYGMSEEELEIEVEYWRAYVENHIPQVYPGIREIMQRHRSEGGILAVSSHSFEFNILRDYKHNDLPVPDAVFGWELSEDKRKPNPYSIEKLMADYDLSPSDILMIDDLKPGYDMARSCGVDFAAVGWAYDIASIESFMRKNSDFYFKTVSELSAFLF